jgi:hypothetical protein
MAVSSRPPPKSYRSMVDEHLRPAFGQCRSDRFTLATVEEWRAGVAAKIASGTMAPKFYVNLRNLLHGIVAWGQDPGRCYFAQNLVESLERIRLPKSCSQSTGATPSGHWC